MGDFDGDNNQDLLTANDAFTALRIFCWPGDTEFFHSCYPGGQLDFDQKILGVIPGDFNFDGKLDFIATTTTTS